MPAAETFQTTSLKPTPIPHHEYSIIINTPDEIDYEALPEGSTLTAQCIAGAFAGILEHTVMYPVDALKTRMQALSDKTSFKRGGILSSIYKISANEGWFSLWRGTSSVILGAGPAHAVYFGTYEFVKKKLIGDEDGHQPLKIALAGSAATITSEALMNPFDVIKQRMQIKAINSTSGNVLDTAKNLIQNEGFKALYHSYPTTLTMTIPFTALNFVVYESFTKVLNPSGVHDPLKHCLAGGVAGGIAAALTTPLDCIKTFLQTKGLSSDPKVREINSLIGASRVIYQNEGWNGFWKGMRPRIVSNVPATAICWTSYEMAKYYLIK